MKYLSLFSGVGGFELGIQRAFMGFERADPESESSQPEIQQRGKRTAVEVQPSVLSTDIRRIRPVCIGYSEIDKYAIQTYQKNWKGHTNYGDITTINEHELPDFELLVGGFPCQAFSIAGKRKGFDDTRGTLFFDIARILKHKRPRHILLENVKGLLSHDSGKTIQTIASVLSDLGYRIEWQVLNAKDFGVPQNRERIFIVGHLRGECAGQVFPIGTSNGQVVAPGYVEPISGTISTKNQSGQCNFDGSTTLIQQLNNPTHSNDRVYGADGVSPTLNTAQGGNRQPKIVPSLRATDYKNGDTQTVVGIKASYRNGLREADMSPTIDTMYKKGMPGLGQDRAGAIDNMKIRRLTPTECERLMSWPDGWTEGVSDTQRYKQCGNGVVSNCVQAITEQMIKEGCL